MALTGNRALGFQVERQAVTGLVALSRQVGGGRMFWVKGPTRRQDCQDHWDTSVNFPGIGCWRVDVTISQVQFQKKLQSGPVVSGKVVAAKVTVGKTPVELGLEVMQQLLPFLPSTLAFNLEQELVAVRAS